LKKESKLLQNTKLIEGSRMLVIPHDFQHWTVQLEIGALDELEKAGKKGLLGDSMRGSMRATKGFTLGRGSVLGNSVASVDTGQVTRPLPRGLFDVKQTYAHTAAGVVRLLLRWVGATHRSLALRDVIDDGFIFCLITGLCETRHFSKRKLTKHGIVAILAHRMSLHVAASQQWRALATALLPPRQFQEDGLQGIECAQYTAYYAFSDTSKVAFR
jgi:hypothetical protein